MKKLILLLIFVVLQGCTNKPLPNASDLASFSSQKWISYDGEKITSGISIRQEMLKDLVENVLPNKKMTEVVALLGPSYQTSHFKSLRYDLIYPTGFERNSYISTDSEWLLIWFDKDKVFSKYKIIND